MIPAQKEVLDVCNKLYAIAQEGSLAQDKAQQIDAVQQSVVGQPLLVPIVGQFSAGKSTMINTLLGESVLPVGITPETSLATELHYTDGAPYAEGIRPDGSAQRYEIAQMKQLTADAAQYRSARVYLNSPRLEAIEPLVLVDMPGFSAPNDQHNKAIVEYMDKGIYYIVLMKVTDGTVSRSLLNRLREIDSLGRRFSLFVSNADLVPPAKVEEVKAVCRDVLDGEFGGSIKIGAINNTNAASVQDCLASVNVNALFKNLYFGVASEICDNVIDGLNFQIKAAGIDGSAINDAEAEIQRSIEKIKASSTSDIEHMKSRYSGSIISNIIGDVGEALNGSLDEIVSGVMAKSNVESLLNEIVRSSLMESMGRRLGEVNDGIVADISVSVGDLSEAFQGIDANYSNKIVGILKNSFDSLPIDFAQVGEKLRSGQGVKGEDLLSSLSIGAKMFGPTGTSMVAKAAHPILGVVVALLPTIVEGLFALLGQKVRNDEAESQIRANLKGEVFPQIKNKLRGELPGIMEQQVGEMIAQVRSKYEQMLASQQQELEKARQDKAAKAQTAQANTNKLENLRAEAESLSREILGWKDAQ